MPSSRMVIMPLRRADSIILVVLALFRIKSRISKSISNISTMATRPLKPV